MNIARRAAFMAALALIGTNAIAGTIESRLQAEMDQSAPGTVFSVIVNLKDQADIPTLNQQLESRHATLRDRHAAVITALQAASQSQQSLKDDLQPEIQSGQVLGYTGYWISNLMVVAGTKEAIERIAARSDVDVVEKNFTPELIKPVSESPVHIPDGVRGIGVTPGLRAIHAPEVWHQLHYNGAGRLIGGLDTGVDGNHPALASRWRGAGGQVPWQYCWLDLLGTNTQFPVDTYGHGTHTMGTMTGCSGSTQDTVGVAWGAKWIACNAINQGVGSAFDNDVITAFQWFADPDGNPNTTDDVPDVVQNSWGINESFGGSPPYQDCDSRWWNAIDNCEASGVVVTWSAGNEGPGAHTLRSPADRATTIYNAFSVGAVDATNYQWPYPIAGFSSRGPSGCTNVPQENLIKPEVAAPGVDVYSSVPGGSYQLMSGTSMAGPHVAGTVALLRQANPNLSVDDIKQILMDTARDEGDAGEDNTYGWGFIDAYAAVVEATVGFGQIAGHVTNGSWQNLPVQGATVTLLETNTQFQTDVNGYYSGSAPSGTYHAVATDSFFQPDTAVVVLTSNQLTTQDFSLVDNVGPSFANVYNPGTVTNTVNPVAISATITDPSTVTGATLHYRVNGNNWIDVPMRHPLGDFWTGSIPAHALGTQIDYYLSATDGLNNVGNSPAGAPGTFYTYYLTTSVYSYDCENPDANWSLYSNGDNAAVTGRWVRDDPNGTYYQGHLVQTEDDHTPNPGHICFITGNGPPGDPPDGHDVDNGCTTLTSPTFNLSGASHAFAKYYRWWAQEINADDQFQIDASSDGGSTWTAIERIPGNHEEWDLSLIDLSQYISLTNNVVIRFKACDLGQPGDVEAAVDDFSIETYSPSAAGVNGSTGIVRNELAQNQPNPFNPVTTIKFTLSNPGRTKVEIFDASGRLIRSLADEQMTAGVHQLVWDGLDDAGKQVGSGVYFYRLKAGAFEQSRRMTILK